MGLGRRGAVEDVGGADGNGDTADGDGGEEDDDAESAVEAALLADDRVDEIAVGEDEGAEFLVAVA